MITTKKGTATEFLFPFLCICAVCGLNNKFADRIRSPIFRNLLKYSYSAFFVGGYCILLYIGYYGIDDNFDALLRIELVLKVFIGNITGVILVLCSFVNQRKFMNIIHSMEVREKDLIKYVRNPRNWQINLFMYGQVLLLFLMEGYSFLFTFFKYCNRKDESVGCVGEWLAMHLCPSISHVHSIMFSTLTLIIKRQFTFMNNLLLNAYSEKERTGARMRGMVNLHFTSKRLLLLKKMHSDLMSDSKQINYIFSVSILFKFLDSFLLIFCCIHAFITGFNAPQLLKPYVTESNLLPISNALVAVIELLSIILICQSASAETYQTAVVLHKLYASYKRQKGLIKTVSAHLL